MEVRQRIGVFICHCRENSGGMDVSLLPERTIELDDVGFTADYEYMCSDSGQNKIKEAIAEEDLNGVVVVAHSPSMQKETFRNTVEEAGLNRYRCEIANIRKQCAWGHPDYGGKTTDLLAQDKIKEVYMGI